MPDERRAIETAKEMSHRHDGVIAWARDANPALGEFGLSEALFRAGQIPDPGTAVRGNSDRFWLCGIHLWEFRVSATP